MTPKKTLNDLRDELAEQFNAEVMFNDEDRIYRMCFKRGWNACLSHLEPVLREVYRDIQTATGVLFYECQPDKGELFGKVDEHLKQAADRLRDLLDREGKAND